MPAGTKATNDRIGIQCRSVLTETEQNLQIVTSTIFPWSLIGKYGAIGAVSGIALFVLLYLWLDFTVLSSVEVELLKSMKEAVEFPDMLNVVGLGLFPFVLFWVFLYSWSSWRRSFDPHHKTGLTETLTKIASSKHPWEKPGEQ